MTKHKKEIEKIKKRNKEDKEKQSKRKYKKLKSIPWQLWIYGIIFLIEAIVFNLSLGFGITSLIIMSRVNNWSLYYTLAITFASFWMLLLIFKHINWRILTRKERALYFGIRRFGKNVVEVSKWEVERRSGQLDILEVIKDTDKSEELGLAINGLITLIHIYVGIKWLFLANKFNKNPDEFNFKVVKEK